MYSQFYSPVKIWAPPNRASNLHCFLLLGVRDSKINFATMQPKWLCLQICSTFQEKNIEKDHVFSTSLSWKSTLRASVHLRDFVTFSAPRCSRLPAANVDMPRCRCDFPRRPGKCLSLISHGSRLLTTLYKRHVLFSCDDEVCLAGNAVWSNENCAKIPRFLTNLNNPHKHSQCLLCVFKGISFTSCGVFEGFLSGDLQIELLWSAGSAGSADPCILLLSNHFSTYHNLVNLCVIPVFTGIGKLHWALVCCITVGPSVQTPCFFGQWRSVELF